MAGSVKQSPQEKAVVLIGEKVNPVVDEAKALVISSTDGMREATEMLSMLNKQSDRITAAKEAVTKPLNEALKAERARWKPLESVLEEGIGIIRKKMTEYQTKAKAEADSKKDAIADRVAPGKGNLSAETAIRKMGEVDSPEESVSTDAGQVKFKTVQKFEVVDLSKLPIEYVLANEVAIRAAMKEGKELPGVKYYTEEVPVNFR